MAASLVARRLASCNQIYLNNPRSKAIQAIYNRGNHLCRTYATKNHFTQTRIQRGNWKKIAGFVGAVGLTVYFTDLPERLSLTGSVFAATTGIPKYKPVRTIKSDTDSTGLKLTLYQYQTCPFCCKVRSYLDFHGFSYDVIEVNSVWRTQIKWSQYKKVPILVCEGQGKDGYLQLNDSSVIISSLETFLEDKTLTMEQILSFYPGIETKNKRGKTVWEFPNKYYIMYGDKKLKTTEDERKDERQWRQWADDVLVHALSPNIYRTPGESLQAFHWFSKVGQWEDTFNSFERNVVIYVGATAMYFVGKLLKKRHNLNDDVRISLYDACTEWTTGLKKNGKFMGGDTPNLADLSAFGYLSAIEGCDTFNDLVKNTTISDWYYNTKKSIQSRTGTNPLNAK